VGLVDDTHVKLKKKKKNQNKIKLFEDKKKILYSSSLPPKPEPLLLFLENMS
jgi:hypothetical protein